MQTAIRRLQFAAAPIFDRLHQCTCRVSDIILKVRVAIEIVVAGGVGREVTDVSVDQRQMP